MSSCPCHGISLRNKLVLGKILNQVQDDIFAFIAQLVERTHGKGEVMGSNPIEGSIKNFIKKEDNL